MAPVAPVAVSAASTSSTPSLFAPAYAAPGVWEVATTIFLVAATSSPAAMLGWILLGN